MLVGAVLVLFAAPPARGAAPVVSPEFPVTATDLRSPAANNSPVLVADPRDRRFVVAANRLDAPDYGCSLHVSGDGGRGWIPAALPELPAPAEKCYAPEVAFDGRGRLFVLALGLRGLGNEPAGVWLTVSSDRGRTFEPPWLVLGPEKYMVRMAIDPAAGDGGRIHLVWLDAGGDAPLAGLPPTRNPIVAAHSDDGGRTFSAPAEVSDPERRRVVAPALALGPDGAVSVAYFDLEGDIRDYQGLEGPVWPEPWTLVVTTSGDGGDTFGPGAVVDDGLLPAARVMLIFTMPPPSLVAHRERLHVAWSDARHGDADVFASRSTDGGRTWGPPVRVNDSAVGDGADQFLPRLSVAPDGRLDVVFLDRRHDPDNLRNDATYTYSTDGGRGFAPNLRVSTASSDSRIGQQYLVPSAEGQTEFGSRLGLLSRSQSALAAWPDTRHARLNTAQQDLVAVEVVFPGGEPGGGVPWVPIVLAVVVVGGGAALLLTRSGAGRRVER